MTKTAASPADAPPAAISQVGIVPLADLSGPRRRLRDAEHGQAIRRLAGSLRRHGMIHPIVVEPCEDGTFEVISGGRRCIAVQQAGMTFVPVVTRARDDVSNTEIFLAENEHRRSLDPLEFSDELKLMRDEGASLRDLAQATGRSEGYCSNMLRLRQLPLEVRDLLSDGALSKGQGLAILAAPPEHRKALAFRAARGMTVREIEQEVTRLKANAAGETGDGELSDDEIRTRELVYELARRLGVDRFKVHARRGPSGSGSFTISFRDEQHLEEMLDRIDDDAPEPPPEEPDFSREKSPAAPDAPARRRFQPRRTERKAARQRRSPDSGAVREPGGGRRARPP